MTSTITQIASDLNEQVDNKYALVLDISDLAKRLLEDARHKMDDDYMMGGEGLSTGTSLEKVIYQALVMKASEVDMGDGLIG
jgi:hypothetical protein